MAENSKIEWTDATWNPITGCTLASPGCQHCYAADLAATRLSQHPSREGLTRRNAAGVAAWTGEVRLNEQWLDQPLRWRRPRRIFVCAHADLFHEAVPDEWIDRVFAVMALAPQHTFQVLTKRAARMRKYLAANPGIRIRTEMQRLAGPLPVIEMDWPLPNVWLGVSAEDQQRADERIPDLLATPAAVRFGSFEPLLGPVDLERVGNLASIRTAFPGVVAEIELHMRPEPISGFQVSAIGTPHPGQGIAFYQTPNHLGGFSVGSQRWPHLDFIIVGGESGRHARPMHPDWARSLRDQAQAAGVPFLFKQWGEWAPPEVMTEDGAAQLAFGRRAERAPSLIHVFPDETNMGRIGKRAAGRLLDGVEHNGMPEVRHD